MTGQAQDLTTGGRAASVVRGLAVLGLMVFAAFCLMLAVGAASFVNECRGIACGQLHQAVFAVLAAIASAVAASRVVAGRPAAAIVLVGTLPLLVVHIALVATDPNESTFFPLSTAPPPAIAALALLAAFVRRGARVRTV